MRCWKKDRGENQDREALKTRLQEAKIDRVGEHMGMAEMRTWEQKLRNDIRDKRN
jgi:hypothetical protein